MSTALAVPEKKLDVQNMSELELEILIQVIQRDFELKAAENVRLRRQKRLLKEADDRVIILANTSFNEDFCIICFRRFWPIFFPKRSCYSCNHCMCRNCTVYIKSYNVFICLLCQKERTLKSMGCDWYYDLLRTKFTENASELVAQSLFSDQGGYSFVHIFYHKICVLFKPEWIKNYEKLNEQQQQQHQNQLHQLQYNNTDMSCNQYLSSDLLQKVKGAQISQFRQKIENIWQTFEKRLKSLNRSETDLAKRPTAYKHLREEYGASFQKVLKEFSQVLYVTLENYVARTDNTSININELVVNTVHEEVEQLIGYKINCAPEDNISTMSDVESTASAIVNCRFEDKLAAALVDKVLNDHDSYILENYDTNCFDMMDTMDGVSTSHLVHTRPLRADPSERSSISMYNIPIMRDRIDITETLSSEYQMPPIMMDESSDVNSTIGQPSNVTSMILNKKPQQKQLSRESNESNSRNMVVAQGEQLNLVLEMNGTTNINVSWVKAGAAAQRTVLRQSDTIDITSLVKQNSVTAKLKIWECQLSDSGLYTAFVDNNPVAKFTVKIIESNKTPERPKFSLRFMQASCRAGQPVEFTAQITGYPEPRIKFYHNSQIIDEQQDEKYFIEHIPNINRYTLRVLKTTESDSGVFKCVATNSLGTAECSAKLNVIGINFRFQSDSTNSVFTQNSKNQTLPLSLVPDISPSSLSNSEYLMEAQTTNQQFTQNQSLHQDSKGKSPYDSDSEINSETNSEIFVADTMVGREVANEYQKSESQPRESVGSTASHNKPALDNTDDDSDDGDPTILRSKAIQSAKFTLPDQRNSVSELRKQFENDKDVGNFFRTSSITNRYNRGESPKTNQKSITREVRVHSESRPK